MTKFETRMPARHSPKDGGGEKAETPAGETAWLNRLQWPLFVLAAAGFLFFKYRGVHYTASGDENVYFYMARLLNRGRMVYRDFFFARPPLQLLLLAAVDRVAGFNLFLGKATAFVPALAAAAVVYRRFWKTGDGWAGVFFLGLFLFNYELLKVSNHPMGLNLAVFFLALSLVLFLRDRPAASGLAWGLGALVGLYALPWGAVPVGYYLFRPPRRRQAARFLAGFFAVFLPVNLALTAAFGRDYFLPVYLYHFLKPSGLQSVFSVFRDVVFRNPAVFVLPLILPVFRRSGKGTAVFAAALVYLLFLASLDPLFSQYFILPLPYLCWAAAAGLSGIVTRLKGFPYRWTAANLILAALAASGIDAGRRYLARERLIKFDYAEEAAAFIRENSRPEDLLFGHVTVAPLLALLSDREIAADLVDTNRMRFDSGLLDLEKVLGRMEGEENLKFFIVREEPPWNRPAVKRFLSGCRPVASFPERRGRIFIHDCSNSIFSSRTDG